MILVMSDALPLATVKARLSELVDRVAREDDRVVVTRRGQPAAVLISPADLESLEETLEILSDPQLVEEIREGEAALARGEVHSMDEVVEDLKARRSTGT
jgi:prevent-host-death family protein